ncbi:MAG: amidoligase family protein [Pseudomonadota bacterium]
MAPCFTTDTHFKPLPVTRTEADEPRRVGCEVEFAGLDEQDVAQALKSRLGGQIDQENEHVFHLKNTSIGGLKIALDTALPKDPDTAAARAVTGLLAKVVPVEIVTPPLPFEDVTVFSDALDGLATQGAVGSQNGMLYGFGVHLNVELPGLAHPHTYRTIRAFAALEPVLREVYPINLTRRVMPFIKTWPDGFVQELFERRPMTLMQVMAMAANHIASRNYALDLFPMFKEGAPRAFEAFFPHDTATKARPSFHFRLPDSRVGEQGWSLLEAWTMWRLIEDVAQDDQVLPGLEEQWLRARDPDQSITQSEAIARTKDLLEAHLT